MSNLDDCNDNFDIESINATLLAVHTAQSSMQSALTKLISAVNTFNQKVLEIERRLTIVDELKSENSELKKRIQVLEQTTADLEQHKFAKTIEIKGIPIINNEDIINTIGVVAENISCQVQVQVHTIVATFTSQLKQREFLRAARKKKPSMAPLCSSLGIKESEQHGNIYVNESVNKKARFLLKIGRDLEREKKIHWIGTESGNVVARKSFGGKKFLIKEQEDLQQLSNLDTKAYSEPEPEPEFITGTDQNLPCTKTNEHFAIELGMIE
jgi:Baculovirus FP protein